MSYIPPAEIKNTVLGDIEYASSSGVSSHTGNTDWQDKVSKTFTSEAGDYAIVGFALMSTDDTNELMGLRIDIDGSTQKAQSTAQFSGDFADGNYFDKTAIAFVTLTAASHTIKLQYNTGNAAATVYIKEASLLIRRIN